ncbi:MAG TPA: HDIG domain-containing protein [Tepidisphaeraceae bacterium]|nr:HDIG domain-containing protein [Tepidisphaeraceae bacterium]
MLPWLSTKRRLSPKIQESSVTDRVRGALRTQGAMWSLIIAGAFWISAALILLLRTDVVEFRPGEFARSNVYSRVDFQHFDEDKFALAKEEAQSHEPNVYKMVGDPWEDLEQSLLVLPERVRPLKYEQLDFELASTLDNASLARLQEYADPAKRDEWSTAVKTYIASIRKLQLVILSDDRRQKEVGQNRMIRIDGIGLKPPTDTFAPGDSVQIAQKLEGPAVDQFRGPLVGKIVRFSILKLGAEPTHDIDEPATVAAQNTAAARVPESAGLKQFIAGQRLINAGIVGEPEWNLLRAENRAFRESLGSARYTQAVGLFGVCLIITLVLSLYVAIFQNRIVRNHTRALALALLLLGTLLVVELAGIGSSRIYLTGIGPTILVAMVLAIGYDRRFAFGISSLHAILATMALGESITFFLTLFTGAATCSFMMTDLRSRIRLIEVGAVSGIVLLAATFLSGLLEAQPVGFVMQDALYAGAAGLFSGFLVLGVLPFVERVFRIATPLTLLELADTSNPLLRKLAREAPGTYNHSIQVATLCEEACSAIGADALLARVGAYYHDVGKMNKPEYFVENQRPGESNRHLALNPNVSKMIIIGHVKDGWELARQYNLPTTIFPFIRAHHGTTVVEYFFHAAQKRDEARGEDSEGVERHEFRYPGPKPRSKEVAILMLADASESATRALDDPTPAKLTAIVEQIVQNRMLDGQLNECELTMHDLEVVRQSLIRSLLAIHHPRIAYPTDEKQPVPQVRPDSAASAG